jgi:hypothetical protein
MRILENLLYVRELSRRLNSIKSFRAISRVRCLYETDVSRTISVIIIIIIIIRDQEKRRKSLMMMTEMVLETSVSYRQLEWLIAREDFIELQKPLLLNVKPYFS